MGLDPKNLPASMRSMMSTQDRAAIFGEPNGQVTIPDEIATDLVFQKTTDEEKLNKLEKAWLAELRRLHPAERIGIQSLTLKLADQTRYTPDFWTIDPNGQLFFWETKGFMRDDAWAKLKVAARQFRWARFILVKKHKGSWIETPVNP